MGQKQADKEAELLRGGGLVHSIGGLSRLDEHCKGEKWASDERILGHGRFVQAVLEKTASNPLAVERHRDAAQRRESLESLLKAICNRLGVTRTELVSGSKRREVSRARKVFSHLSLRHLGLTASEVSRATGVSGQAILKAAEQGQDVLRELAIDVEELIELGS